MKSSALNLNRLTPHGFGHGSSLVPVEEVWKQSLDDPEETQSFARLVRQAVEQIEPRRVLDVGCGSGIPTIEAAMAHAPRVLGIDLIPRNVFIARRNIRMAKLEARVTAHLAAWQDVLAGDFYPGEVDMVVANPPYVPSGDGSAVDGGPKGTRMLDSIIDGLPATVRGVALLFSSLSDPLQVLARVEKSGFQVTRLFTESVPFGRYTSVPRTLSALHQLRSRGSAWFSDVAACPEAHEQRGGPTAAMLAPHAYLRLGLIAERRSAPSGARANRSAPSGARANRSAPEDDGVVSFREMHRCVARLLESYQRGGPDVLADFSLIEAGVPQATQT